MMRFFTLALAGFLFCTACATAPAASFGGSKDGSKDNAGKGSLKAQALPLPPPVIPEVEAKLAALDIAAAIARYDAALAALPAYGAVPAPSAVEDLALARSRIVEAVKSLSLEIVSAPEATVAKKPFKKPFSVRVTGPAGKSVPSVPVHMETPSFLEDDTVSAAVMAGETGEDGTVSWESPAPSRSADSFVRFSLGYRSADSVLSAELETAGAESAASIPYLAGTLNKAVPTSLSFLDFGANGKPLGGMGLTATACLKPLVKMGFTRIGMADFQAQLAAGDETALIAAAKKLFGSAVDRLIYGTTRIVSVTKGEDGLWTAVVATEASVWNFKTGAKTWSGRCEASASGKTEAAAITAARDTVAGSLLPLKLYYNL